LRHLASLLRSGKTAGTVMSETLLREIADYCRRTRMAESTFGRLAVNDGKLLSRLRLGGRVTTTTMDRVRAFIERDPPPRGDGTVLARTMRAMHHRFPTMPFYIVGKEISLEDVRLVLEKMPDRLYEHPATVLVMTNMTYAEAPWLKPNAVAAATSLVWHELA